MGASVATYSDTMSNLVYTLDDSEIWNDILSVQGDAGSEIMVRAVNTNSIQKYGRRTYRLPWALGATEADMITLVNAALTKYSEPTAKLSMTLKGEDDTNIVQIFSRVITEKVTVVNTTAGINADYFINGTSLRELYSGKMPELDLILEAARFGE